MDILAYVSILVIIFYAVIGYKLVSKFPWWEVSFIKFISYIFFWPLWVLFLFVKKHILT